MNCYLTEFDSRAHVEVIRQATGAQLPDERGVEPQLGGSVTLYASGGGCSSGLCLELGDTNDLMLKAIEQDVLFVPGRDFFPDASGHRFMRLNFSTRSRRK